MRNTYYTLFLKMNVVATTLLSLAFASENGSDSGDEPPGKTFKKSLLSESNPSSSDNNEWQRGLAVVPFGHLPQAETNHFFELFNNLNIISKYYLQLESGMPQRKPILSRLGVFNIEFKYTKVFFKNSFTQWVNTQQEDKQYLKWANVKDSFLNERFTELRRYYPASKREELYNNYKEAFEQSYTPSLQSFLDKSNSQGFAPNNPNKMSFQHFIFIMSPPSDLNQNAPLSIENLKEQATQPKSRNRKVHFNNNTPSELPHHGHIINNSITAYIDADVNQKDSPAAELVLPTGDIGFDAVRLRQYLVERIMGQDHAMQILAVHIHMHYLNLKLKNWYQENNNHFPTHPAIQSFLAMKKSNVLIVGPTGCGKTLSMDHIEQYFKECNLNIPVIKTSAASLTRTGYVGPSVSDIFKNLLSHVNYDLELAQNAIIYIDEIDKIASVSESTGRDIGGSAVQNELLEVLQGTDITVTFKKSPNPLIPETEVTLNTTNMLFICGGAFKGMQSEQADYISDSKLEDFGFGKEFMGRLQQRIMFNTLTKESIKLMLGNPHESRIIQMQTIYKLGYNIDLFFNEKAIDAIAAKAILFPTGARILQSIVDRLIAHKIPVPALMMDHKIEFTEKDVEQIIKMPELSDKEKEKKRKEDEEIKKAEDEKNRRRIFESMII